MGCGGGYRDFFRVLDGCGNYRRSYGSDRHDYHDSYNQDDTEEKLTIIKKMYAADLINDDEYQMYKQRIYDRSISFDELVAIKKNRTNEDSRMAEPVETQSASNELSGKYKVRMKKLEESKKKIIQVQDKLLASIKGLEKEKGRMEELAEIMLKSSEEKAEIYINQKIDLEENIQNLVRRSKELEAQLEEIDRAARNLEAKELELEAARLKEELSQNGL